MDGTSSSTRETQLRTFFWSFLVYTVVVILWGAYVRASGSGAGCGSHWPTCDGHVIPRSFTVAKVIEFTHRISSGFAWVLALVGVVWTRRRLPKGHRVRRGAAAVLVLMTTEALVGAGLVLFKMVAHNESTARAGWMAAHLVNTFLLLFSLALTAYFASGGAPLRLRRHRAASWGYGVALAAVLVLGVSGAVAALGDTLFPASTLAQGLHQDLSPAAHLFVRLRIFHPLLAMLVAGGVILGIGVTGGLGDNRRVRRMAVVVAAIFVAQVGLGFLNVLLLAPIYLQLVHLLFADLVWLSLSLLSFVSLSGEVEAEATAPEDAAPDAVLSAEASELDRKRVAVDAAS